MHQFINWRNLRKIILPIKAAGAFFAALLFFAGVANANVAITTSDGKLVVSSAGQIISGASIIDFMGGSLPSGSSFVRASSKYRYTSTGAMELLGSNAASFDYNPSTLSLLGIRIDPLITNNFGYSITPGATVVSKTGSTLTTSQGTDPAGGSTAASLVESTANSRHSISEGVNFVAGTTYAQSIYVYPQTGTVFQMTAGSAVTNQPYANFNLTGSGSVTYVGTGVTSSRVDALSGTAAGWYRVCITYVATSTTTGYPVFAFTNNNTASGYYPTYTGTGLTALVWGFQNATGGGCDAPLVPTSGSVASHQADALSFTVPSGVGHLTYHFAPSDIGTTRTSCATTTQTVAVSSGSYTIPTNLNCPHIQTIEESP